MRTAFHARAGGRPPEEGRPTSTPQLPSSGSIACPLPAGRQTSRAPDYCTGNPRTQEAVHEQERPGRRDRPADEASPRGRCPDGGRVHRGRHPSGGAWRQGRALGVRHVLPAGPGPANRPQYLGRSADDRTGLERPGVPPGQAVPRSGYGQKAADRSKRKKRLAALTGTAWLGLTPGRAHGHLLEKVKLPPPTSPRVVRTPRSREGTFPVRSPPGASPPPGCG